MPTRFNAYEKTTLDFLDKILVSCPKCNKKAIVKAMAGMKSANLETQTKLTCPHCGYNKILAETPMDSFYTSKGKPMEVRHFYMNTAVDPYFKRSLWLQKECPAGLFWAYNYEHLHFLEQHIAATLRQRDLCDIQNRSIGSRLPKWMTAAGNREELLRVINKLKDK